MSGCTQKFSIHVFEQCQQLFGCTRLLTLIKCFEPSPPSVSFLQAARDVFTQKEFYNSFFFNFLKRTLFTILLFANEECLPNFSQFRFFYISKLVYFENNKGYLKIPPLITMKNSPPMLKRILLKNWVLLSLSAAERNTNGKKDDHVNKNWTNHKRWRSWNCCWNSLFRFNTNVWSIFSTKCSRAKLKEMKLNVNVWCNSITN